MATAGGALVGFFLFAATPLFPLSAFSFPWYLGGALIGAFGILQTLRVVYLAESDFLADCGDASLLSDKVEVGPSERRWKKTIRYAFSAAFMVIWITGVSSFYLYGVAIRDGSPNPTATHTVAINNHGTNVYVRSDQKQLIDRTQLVMMIGIPAIALTGLAIHFFLGVRLFPNVSTLRDQLDFRRDNDT